jgi:hypothetical protein
MLKMKLLTIAVVCLIASSAFGQNAPTNAPQFQVQLNYLGSQPYGQSSALSTAVTSQFTTNTALRFDVLAMPGAGYTGYIGGAQYYLCGLSALEKLLMPTSLSCGKFSPYLSGGLGMGQIQSQLPGGTTERGAAGLIRVGANYDPTGSGVFTLNLFEGGWGHFGPSIPGEADQGWFFQSGISVGLGSSAATTQAKIARKQRADAKKRAKLLKAMQKS